MFRIFYIPTSEVQSENLSKSAVFNSFFGFENGKTKTVMENSNFNRYLFKALEAYPYELDEAIEALGYALSYDAKNVQALCLMGKIYWEQLGEYEAAKECYAEAMASNMDMPTIYQDLLKMKSTVSKKSFTIRSGKKCKTAPFWGGFQNNLPWKQEQHNPEYNWIPI